MKWKWPELAQRWKGALGNYQYVLLVLAVGVVLLLLPAGEGRDSPADQGGGQEGEEAFVLADFEGKLARTLSQIEGAGETSVVLSLDGSSRQILAQDREQDGGGGGSSTVVTVGKGSGSQGVVPLQTVAPSFRGALVVCPGGNDPQIRLRLIEAVSALTGLGADRISVCGGNT